MSFSKMSYELTLKDTIFREFLKNPDFGPSEMAEHLKANYNSVKAAFAKLADEDLLDRPERGNYEPSFSGIVLNLISRLEELERKIQEIES
jgi:Mn-dependent DtxR family transcriptional regulator